GLSVVLYDLYKVVIWRPMEPFYARGGCYERPASLGVSTTYNNMGLTCQMGPCNKYWFELLRRPAPHPYLNMDNGTHPPRGHWSAGARRLWKKVRAQPLHRLPGRVFRRLRRDLVTALA